jgi:hypothetical protein
MVSMEHHGAMMSGAKVLASGGVDSTVALLAGCCFVDRARNTLVREFLKTDATHLFFVDADIGFDPLVLPRFIESPHDILVGIPPKRKPEPEFHIGKATNAVVHGAFEAKEVPTAFMCIKRHVFAVLDAAYPDLLTAFKAGVEDPPPYFQSRIVDGEFLGEDIFFCRLWTALGQSVWIDAQVDFSHRGSHPFKGNALNYLIETKQVVLKQENGQWQAPAT